MMKLFVPFKTSAAIKNDKYNNSYLFNNDMISFKMAEILYFINTDT